MITACYPGTTDEVESFAQEGLTTDGFRLNGLNGWGNGISMNGLSHDALNGLNLNSWLTLEHAQIDDNWWMCYCVEQSYQEERAVYAHICCLDPYYTW